MMASRFSGLEKEEKRREIRREMRRALTRFVGLVRACHPLLHPATWALAHRVWSSTANKIDVEFPLSGLIRYLLPRETRERVFMPCHYELLGAYVTARRHRNKWFRRWLSICFTLRTAGMVAECLRVMLIDKAIRCLRFFSF
jgi:hypothetical protein